MEPPPSTRDYEVRKNDSFWKIAAKHLGDGLRYPEIMVLNPSVAEKDLRAGMMIRLPITEESAPGGEAEVLRHRVRDGETLSQIALSYYGRPTWRRIYQANRSQLRGPDRVRAGIVLKIPPR